MIQEFINDPLNKAWPFWALELNPDCSNSDIRKASQLISSKLTLGAPNADVFITPDGHKNRDDFLVREAKAILDDPAQRLIAEFWYTPPTPQEESEDNELSSEAATNKQLTITDWLTILRLRWVV